MNLQSSEIYSSIDFHRHDAQGNQNGCPYGVVVSSSSCGVPASINKSTTVNSCSNNFSNFKKRDINISRSSKDDKDIDNQPSLLLMSTDSQSTLSSCNEDESSLLSLSRHHHHYDAISSGEYGNNANKASMSMSDIIEEEASKFRQRRHKHVSFNCVIEIQLYSIILGDHPSCMDGLPISLDWEHSKPIYRSIRQSQQRTTMYCLPRRLSYKERKNKLFLKKQKLSSNKKVIDFVSNNGGNNKKTTSTSSKPSHTTTTTLKSAAPQDVDSIIENLKKSWEQPAIGLLPLPSCLSYDEGNDDDNDHIGSFPKHQSNGLRRQRKSSSSSTAARNKPMVIEWKRS